MGRKEGEEGIKEEERNYRKASQKKAEKKGIKGMKGAIRNRGRKERKLKK